MATFSKAISKDVEDNFDYEGTSASAKIDPSGKLVKWLNLEVLDVDRNASETAGVKLSGAFADGRFEGELVGGLDSGAICVATLRLGPKESIHADSLITGKDPETIARERQKAKITEAPAGNQSAAVRTEADQIAKRLSDEIAKRLAEQEKTRKLEEERTAKRRESVKRQEELALKRQAELEARLAKLEDQTKRKTEELAYLRQQQSAKPHSNFTANINFGNYHALVIGIDNYKNLIPLKTAVADAEAVAKVLSEAYDFKVTKLINPTRSEILDTLDDLRTNLEFKDNLLVYYAGHGWLDEAGDEGYWLPANAKKNRQSGWVSNASITTNIRALKAKHVMVVADSCFSGRMVRDANVKIENADTPEYFQQMSRKKTRVVITSGGLEPVEDGKGAHSPFARAFLQVLYANNSVIDGSNLFNAIRRPVMVEANQTPQYSDVRRAGHDGGEFLFVRRK